MGFHSPPAPLLLHGRFSETNEDLGLKISSHIPVILKPFKISLVKTNVICISHLIP